MPDSDFDEVKFRDLMVEIRDEVKRAELKYDPFKSSHEAYAVLLEESEELWETIRKKQPPERTREEAIQVAAATICFLMDLL